MGFPLIVRFLTLGKGKVKRVGRLEQALGSAESGGGVHFSFLKDLKRKVGGYVCSLKKIWEVILKREFFFKKWQVGRLAFRMVVSMVCVYRRRSWVSGICCSCLKHCWRGGKGRPF